MLQIINSLKYCKCKFCGDTITSSPNGLKKCECGGLQLDTMLNFLGEGYDIHYDRSVSGVRENGDIKYLAPQDALYAVINDLVILDDFALDPSTSYRKTLNQFREWFDYAFKLRKDFDAYNEAVKNDGEEFSDQIVS